MKPELRHQWESKRLPGAENGVWVRDPRQFFFVRCRKCGNAKRDGVNPPCRGAR